uniref:Uncharacterized protein n=1 Tax=Mustela putorius furo TaxID=9669 RepID=M3Z639_MUSPF
ERTKTRTRRKGSRGALSPAPPRVPWKPPHRARRSSTVGWHGPCFGRAPAATGGSGPAAGAAALQESRFSGPARCCARPSASEPRRRAARRARGSNLHAKEHVPAPTPTVWRARAPSRTPSGPAQARVRRGPAGLPAAQPRTPRGAARVSPQSAEGTGREPAPASFRPSPRLDGPPASLGSRLGRGRCPGRALWEKHPQMTTRPGPEIGRAGSPPARLPDIGHARRARKASRRRRPAGRELTEGERRPRWPPTLGGQELRLGRARWDGDEVPDRGPGTPDAGGLGEHTSQEVRGHWSFGHGDVPGTAHCGLALGPEMVCPGRLDRPVRPLPVLLSAL